MAVAFFVEGRTVFWFVIFGWSGIAATFCPTLILSLYWKGFTRNGALAAMVSGFLCVPLFKFGAPAMGVVGPYLVELAELPPAFLVSGLVGIAVSLMDKPGQAVLEGIDAELAVSAE
jgi:Na+/proline symporter